eukprot:349601-Chlamydomonas_euryale.AAC.1
MTESNPPAGRYGFRFAIRVARRRDGTLGSLARGSAASGVASGRPPPHTRERPRHALSARAAAPEHSQSFSSPARRLPPPSELRSA